MELEVRLTDRARADIEDIFKYLQENWPEHVKMDFLVRLNEQFKLIGKMPYMFRASPKRLGVCECVMNKHTIIYYRIVEERFVQILSIQSTRRGIA